ncbi:MAG: hypothetical protein ACN4A7_01365 [Thermacetogeniaceae bacterium]|jgi:hypothetical protein
MGRSFIKVAASIHLPAGGFLWKGRLFHWEAGGHFLQEAGGRSFCFL